MIFAKTECFTKTGEFGPFSKKIYFEKFRQIGGIFARMKLGLFNPSCAEVTDRFVVSCIFYPRLLSIHRKPFIKQMF
jgi:hypothetical protein